MLKSNNELRERTLAWRCEKREKILHWIQSINVEKNQTQHIPFGSFRFVSMMICSSIKIKIDDIRIAEKIRIRL